MAIPRAAPSSDWCPRNKGRLVEHLLQGGELVGFPRRLVPADTIDAGKAHGDARLVAGGALQAFEGDLQHQTEALVSAHGAHGSEAFYRVVAHELVQALQLLVGETEIGLAHRRQA